jgi:hypothetical protein
MKATLLLYEVWLFRRLARMQTDVPTPCRYKETPCVSEGLVSKLSLEACDVTEYGAHDQLKVAC